MISKSAPKGRESPQCGYTVACIAMEETPMFTRVILSFSMIFAMSGIASFAALAADPVSAFSEIMAKKKLTACVVPAYQPYSAKDAGGNWSGFAVEMAKDVANSMRVEVEFVET